MSVHLAYIRLAVVLALASVALFTTSAVGQTPATRSNITEKPIVAAQGPRSANTEKKIASSQPKPGIAENIVAADEPKPKDLQSEVEAIKAENAVVRELLRKMEEQQK